MKRQTFKIWGNVDQTLLISAGGNRKTKQVVELTLVPSFIVDNWNEIKSGEKNSIRMGKLYVDALQSRIESVCPSECQHLQNKTCYVQHNPRNAAQVVGILNGFSGICLTSSELQLWLKAQKLGGITNIRSMVAGDAGTIPESAWKALERVILGIFAAKQWLGYTHAWKTATWLKNTHVASVENNVDALEARSKGWAIFETGNPVLDLLPTGATLCPSSRQFANYRGYKIGCVDCPIRCNGTTGRYTIIPRHAMGDQGKWRSANKKGIQIKDSKGRLRGAY